jgi:hypothetical protein
VVFPKSEHLKKTIAVMTNNSKSKTKSAVVGPKKSWSKMTVKTAAGNSRKRKVISSSESEYNVEEDVLNIFPYKNKSTTGKKTLQTVASVPIDKVSFHLQSW